MAVAEVRLTCQADVSQYAIKWDLEPIPWEAEQLGHSPVKENSLGLSVVCLIDGDIGQSQSAPISSRLPGREQKSRLIHYQFNHTGVVRQVKCRQSNGGSPRMPLGADKPNSLYGASCILIY